MKYEKIKKDYLKKIKKIIRLNQNYFDKDEPLVSDNEYDLLKKDILNLEKKYDFLNHENSPSQTVGYKPSKNFKKFAHKVPMLSLANAFGEEDLINFEKRILNYLDKKNNLKIEYSAEPKIDGISASLFYKNGQLIRGLSRGDGKEGEDITNNLKTISDIPHLIKEDNFPEEIDIRGEVFIKNSDFKKLSNKFANPRNAASGSLRQKDPKETKKIPLKFIAYTFGFIGDHNFENQSDFLNELKNWGFLTSQHNKVIKSIDDLVTFHNQFEEKRF